MAPHGQVTRASSLVGENALLSAFIAAGGVGLLLGLWFRVPAMVAVSALVAATCLPLALTNQGVMSAVVMTVALLTTLQFGFMAGLMLAFAWSKTFAASACLADQRRVTTRRRKPNTTAEASLGGQSGRGGRKYEIGLRLRHK
jgi:hypothetical protein